MTVEYRRASDVLRLANEIAADWTLEDVESDFILKAIEEVETTWGPAVVLLCERNGEMHRWVTWSGTIIDQARRLKGKLPVIAHVEKRRSPRGTYLTLV